MLHPIQSRIRQLDGYFLRALEKSMPEELQSDLSRHGVVLICGFIERSVELVILSKFERPHTKREARFIRAHFRYGTNYSCEAIKQLLDRFDPNWGSKFADFTKSRDDVVQGIISVYALRNSIAHGGTASIGINGAMQFYLAAQAVIEGMWKAMV